MTFSTLVSSTTFGPDSVCMAAGIGEVSAIATFLQVGLSIGKTLNNYIEGVKDAPTEVCDLASEINTTLWQAGELKSLIASNDPSNGLNTRGVVFAQRCLAESEKIVEKITTLLQKTGSSANTTTEVTLESIELTLSNKLKWPILKPQLEKLKRSLGRIRIDICLLSSMHKARTGATKEERDTASDAVVKFLQSRVTAKAVLRKVTAMQKDNMDEPQSPPPSRVRFSDPKKLRRRKTPRPSGYHIDLGPDMEPMTLTGKDSEDVHIQFTSLTSAIREMINDELQAEETARKRAEEEKQKHEQEILEDYKRSLVEKYTDLERKAAALREQLKRGFEPELPDEQIDSHIKRLQAKELSDDEILKRIAELGLRQTGSHEIESDQATLVSTSNRPENSRLWSQLKRSMIDVDRNPIPIALRQNHSIPGLAKVTSISLSFDGEEWHVVQINVSMPWLIKRLAAEEKRDSKSIGKINETLKAYSKLPRECRFAAEAWLQAAGNRKYAWALLYAHTTKTSVSKPRKMLQKAVFGSAIEAQVDNVFLVYRATRESHGHSRDDRKAEDDAEEEIEPPKTLANGSTTAAPPTERPPDSPASQRSVPKPAPDSRRGPDSTNPFNHAYNDLPPPPLHSGPYPQFYPYPSTMSRPPPPYAGTPFSPYSPYPAYAGNPPYDPFANPYQQPYMYPASNPFNPSGYDYYAPPTSAPAPPPPPPRSPPTSKRRSTTYFSDDDWGYGDRSRSSTDRRDSVYRPPSPPPPAPHSSSRGSRSVVIHDPRTQPVYSSDERKRGSRTDSRRASSRRDDSHRVSTLSSSRPAVTEDYDSDESWSKDDRTSTKPPAINVYNRSYSSRPFRRDPASDSGYSSRTTKPLEETQHQPPNWVLYRSNSTANESSPDVSDDDSNLSLDAKTLKESELRERLLSKYTTSEVGSSSRAAADDRDGPRIEEIVSENGNGLKKDDGVDEVVEEDEWGSFSPVKKDKKKKKSVKINGIKENGEKDQKEEEDPWGGFATKKTKKAKKVNIWEDEPPPPSPPAGETNGTNGSNDVNVTGEVQGEQDKREGDEKTSEE